MGDDSGKTEGSDPFAEMLKMQVEATQAMLGQFASLAGAIPSASPLTADPAEFAQWASVMQRMSEKLVQFQPDLSLAGPPQQIVDPAAWFEMVEGWYKQ
ncbi:MAG: hypothetical protein ACKOPQ_11670, partial [Novosphingobium sp.]